VLGHQSLTIQRTAIEADVDTGLLKAVLRFRAPEGNIRANNAIFVGQDHRECFKEVGETTNRQFSTLTIFEDCMTQPGLGYPISLSDLTEQTALAGCYQRSRMRVFQESVTMLPRDFDLCDQLDARPVEIFLIPLIAGGAKHSIGVVA